MSTEMIVLLVVVAIVLVGAMWFMSRKKHSDELREHFGSEYEHAVDEFGDRRQAESELEARRKRVDELNIRPISARDQEQFATEWKAAQAQFVDDPKGAIQEADDLVGELMQKRGYPVGDFEQRAADISVKHPNVVTNYRAAHHISIENDRGAASTEDLRQAMVHYKSLFEELLETKITTGTDHEEEYHARAS